MIEHPFRLRRIELRDFKSVSEADVRLAPLTVVVGANSAGKSTLLQSILALTQAVRSDNSSAEFPLNGEFVRLGTFEETHNFLAERPDTPIEVAFEIVGSRTRPRREAVQTGEERARRRQQLQFTWRARLIGQGDEGIETSGFARLESLQVEVSSMASEGPADGVLELTCDINEFGGLFDEGDAALRLGTDGLGRLTSPGPTRSRWGAPPISASGRVADWIKGDSASVDAVSLSGCLPVMVLRRQERFERLSDLWWDVATEFLSDDIERFHLRAAESESLAPARSSYKAVKVAALQIAVMVNSADEGSMPGRAEPPKESLLRQLGSLKQRDRQSVAKSLATIGQTQYRKRLRKELRAASWIDQIDLVGPPGDAGDILWEFGSASQRAFGESVRYLGPLREAPHVLYDPGPTKRDLGVAGQYSAAVLHAQANTRVLMPTPEGGGAPRRLGDALDFWLREFGLADGATSNDQGRMGIALSVRPTGTDREVDLTSVGVGVSQVLPVILLCLLAGPGDLVILEQPELHLHPKLQQDLADFLLACTRAGRQLVIETHSEHLVNRLRSRIAQDETDATHDLIRLVFAENRSGVTSYREPEVNSYGGLGQDWPTGFLDLTASESQELVRHALAKRQRDESGARG